MPNLDDLLNSLNLLHALRLLEMACRLALASRRPETNMNHPIKTKANSITARIRRLIRVCRRR